MYKALYRQYRPIIFDDVFGQDTIIKTLKNSIINKSFGHAYMFFGPRGTGKTSVSKIFARSLNCLNPQNGNTCGECQNCINSFQKDCVDIIEIDAASNNGVDEIRELRNNVSLVPSELKYKVYIIDEVHMLSIGAFNALLKTLEEPPEHVVFILATTDPQKVPETIISRCQCFSFKRISTENITQNLQQICQKENIDIEDEVIQEISYACDGGMRDALSSLDQLRAYSDKKITLEDYANVNGSLTNKEIEQFYTYIFNEDYANVLSSIKKYNDQGKNIINILEKLMRFMRDKIVQFYLTGTEPQFDINFIHNFVLLINEKIIDIKKSSNPTVFIEMLILEFMNKMKMDSKQINFDKSISDTLKSLKNDEINLEKAPKNITETIENKEFGKNSLVDKNYGENSEKIENINDDNSLSDKKNNNPQENEKEIQNIDEIMKIRVNNTLAKANKKLLVNEISRLDLFNEYTFDQNIGFIACSILDAKIRAVSEDNIIMSYEYDSIVKQNLLIIHKIIEVYNMITNSSKKIAIISDKEWEFVKNQYITDIKNGLNYEVKDEPEEIFIEHQNDDIISNNAIELFGDIVEIN